MVWDYLFDSEYRQRRDIEALKHTTALAAEVADGSMEALRRVNEQYAQRIGRLELTVEGLVRVLQERQGLTREELALMIQRVDLADGVEDGSIGPDRTAQAPGCPSCGRPLNPRRDSCLYCDASIDREKLQPTPPPPRLVTCVRCLTEIPERESYFSGNGLICTKCFQQ